MNIDHKVSYPKEGYKIENVTYVWHKPCPAGNRQALPGESSYLVPISLKILSIRAASYLGRLPTPNLNVEKNRGLPKTLRQRLIYSCMQSKTVMRSLPSMIDMSLFRFSHPYFLVKREK